MANAPREVLVTESAGRIGRAAVNTLLLVMAGAVLATGDRPVPENSIGACIGNGPQGGPDTSCNDNVPCRKRGSGATGACGLAPIDPNDATKGSLCSCK